MSLAESPWALPATAATRPVVLPSGHVLQAWAPAPGESHRLGWYEPAAALGQANRAAALPALPLEDLRFLGRIDRADGPALWAYADPGRDRTLLVDVAGNPYAVVDDARRKAGHRFERQPFEALAELGVPVQPHSPTGAVVLPFRRRPAAEAPSELPE